MIGIPTRFRRLQLVYCFAIETQVQTKPKSLPPADCEPDSDQLQKSIFGGMRKVKKKKKKKKILFENPFLD